jgi:predicted metal-binding membrane protein
VVVGVMDMGVATELGPFPPFLATWTVMMAAMMLPGALPAVVRHGRAAGALRAVVFAESYLAVWAAAGIAVYALDRPHGTTAAGIVVLAAAAYELTPAKRWFRRRCTEPAGGLGFGLRCAGSSGGLMAAQVAVGLMNLPAMVAVTAVVTAQKLLPPRAAVDVPVALAVAGLGVALLVAPGWVPGAVPTM